jgi:hypothetical protein
VEEPKSRLTVVVAVAVGDGWEAEAAGPKLSVVVVTVVGMGSAGDGSDAKGVVVGGLLGAGVGDISLKICLLSKVNSSRKLVCE